MAYKTMAQLLAEREQKSSPKVETGHIETTRSHDIELLLHKLDEQARDTKSEKDVEQARHAAAEMIRSHTNTEGSRADHSAAGRETAMRMLEAQKKAKDTPVRRPNFNRYMKQLNSAPRNFRYPS